MLFCCALRAQITKRAEDLDVVLRCVAKSKMNVTGEKIKALLSELLSTLRRHKMMVLHSFHWKHTIHNNHTSLSEESTILLFLYCL